MVEVADLFLAGSGELQQVFLSADDDLEGTLAPAWLATAKELAASLDDLDETAVDTFVTARVYEIAYTAIVGKLKIGYQVEAVGGGRRQRSDKQLDWFEGRLAIHTAVRAGLKALPTDLTTVVSQSTDGGLSVSTGSSDDTSFESMASIYE